MDDAQLIELQRLFQLAHDRGVRELAITQPEFSVKIVTLAPGLAVVAAPVTATTATGTPSPVAPPAPTGYPILSPLVGIFYRSPSPDAPAFVEIGDTVEAGQTICIVEAMKVFNEITTDHAGVVKAIPAENGKLVQVDQPLMVLEPQA